MADNNQTTQDNQNEQTTQTTQPAQTNTQGGYMGAPAAEAPTYEVKVNGEVQKVSLQDALKAYEKVGGADARFREAKQVQTEARTLYRRILDGAATEGEINKFADQMELTPEERQFLLTGEEPGGGQTQAEEAPQRGGKKKEAAIPEGGFLSEDDKSALEYAKVARKQEQERVFKENVLKTIDKASSIGDIKDRVPPESWNDFKEDLYERCRSEVVVRLQVPGARYSPELLNRVLESEINRVKKYGNLFQKKENPINLGLGSSGSMDFQALVQDNKPVERVAGSDPNYAENFVRRVAQRYLKLGK